MQLRDRNQVREADAPSEISTLAAGGDMPAAGRLLEWRNPNRLRQLQRGTNVDLT